jgi:hypothetical protein
MLCRRHSRTSRSRFLRSVSSQPPLAHRETESSGVFAQGSEVAAVELVAPVVMQRQSSDLVNAARLYAATGCYWPPPAFPRQY